MKNTRQVVKVVQVPPPTRGVTTELPLASMRPTDAILLKEVVCRPGALEVRKGWAEHATGFSAEVETLFPYQGVDGTAELFAAAGSGFYDVTVAGTIGAAVVTGNTSAYWNYTQLSNVAGNYLICVNGVDGGVIYNGTTWSAWGITGVASTDISQVAVWKRRVWAVEKDSMVAWYGAADAIAGAMVQFPMSGVFRKGGYLVAIIPWTIDAGQGVDDNLLFVTSQGEIAVYRGTDPASPADFTLQGLYTTGAPVGQRFYTQVGGDVFLLTYAGLVPVSELLQSSNLQLETLRVGRIKTGLQAETAQYGSTQGWELHYYAKENLLIIQVPSGGSGERRQWVMDISTFGWSQLYQVRVLTYTVLGNTLYAGHATEVVNSWTTGEDDGEQINFTIVPAFSTFGSPGNGKRYTLGGIYFETDRTPIFSTKLLLDYKTVYAPGSLAASAGGSVVWGTAKWGLVQWGGGSISYRKRFAVAGYTTAATLAVHGASRGTTTRITAFEYQYEVGGPL